MTDINECAVVNGGCQHDCFNTPGSFTCNCPPGYQLTADGRHCQGKTLLTSLLWSWFHLLFYALFKLKGLRKEIIDYPFGKAVSLCFCILCGFSTFLDLDLTTHHIQRRDALGHTPTIILFRAATSACSHAGDFHPCSRTL